MPAPILVNIINDNINILAKVCLFAALLRRRRATTSRDVNMYPNFFQNTSTLCIAVFLLVLDFGI